MHYVKGQDNIVADELSRNINNISIQNTDLNKIAKMHQHDRELEHHRNELKEYTLNSQNKLLCKTDHAYPRPYVLQ